jgi:hypothetical protein
MGTRKAAVAPATGQHNVFEIISIWYRWRKQVIDFSHVVVFERGQKVKAAIPALTLVAVEYLMPTVVACSNHDYHQRSWFLRLTAAVNPERAFSRAIGLNGLLGSYA